MKLGRSLGVTVVCQNCGKEFITLHSRLQYGFGKFCSRKCSSHWQSKQTGGKHLVGKENARKNWDIRGKRWQVHWVDATGKQYSQTWARWTWEQTYGAIPEGMIVCYKDNDKNNLSLDNLELRSRAEETRKFGRSQKGKRIFSVDTRQKMSDAKKIAYLGEGNPQYIDGRSYIPYTEEFYAKRESILKRDKHTCQACGVQRRINIHVHHIDLNKENNIDYNLLTLCPECHAQVHHRPIEKLTGVLLDLRNRMPGKPEISVLEV